jgi:hypothetical protein
VQSPEFRPQYHQKKKKLLFMSIFCLCQYLPMNKILPLPLGFLRQGLTMQPMLFSNSQSPFSISQVLGLQACTTMPGNKCFLITSNDESSPES